MHVLIHLLAVSTIVSFSLSTSIHRHQTRGLRLDASYLYKLYPGLSVDDLANQVVKSAQVNGVNTLFVLAYSSVYGAYYPTTYEFTTVENGYGKLNFLKALTQAAKGRGFRIVASVPVNNFKQVWQENSAWRAKTSDGQDYTPTEDLYYLSAWHPDFRIWLSGFYADLLSRNPDLDGIEAVEPFVDYFGGKDSDYNIAAVRIFTQKYPDATVDDKSWFDFRAQGLTDLIGILNSAAHAVSKNSYLVQTWSIKPDGGLLSAQKMKKNFGFDFDGILNLTANKKLTYISAELMWQQWAALYGTSNFNPLWTREVSQKFINYVGDRSTPLIHLEITPFEGSSGTTTVSNTEFSDTLAAINDLNVGIDIYDYAQISQLSAWNALLNWY